MCHAYAFIFLWADVYMRLPLVKQKSCDFGHVTLGQWGTAYIHRQIHNAKFPHKTGFQYFVRSKPLWGHGWEEYILPMTHSFGRAAVSDWSKRILGTALFPEKKYKKKTKK